MRLLIAFCTALCLSWPVFAAQPVTISDSLSSPFAGRNAVGSLTISWPTFVESDGTTVPSGSQNVVVSPVGSFTVSLMPNDSATLPGSAVQGSALYTLVFNLTNGQSVTNHLVVPTTNAVLKLSNVLAPLSGWLRAPIGTTQPQHCIPGDIFINQTTQTEQVCIAQDTWINLVNLSQANTQYLADSQGPGLVYRGQQSNSTRPATAGDLTTTLGYTPPNPANALSEYSNNLTGVYNVLGLKSAAQSPASAFLPSTGIIPLGLMPTNIPSSSIVNYGQGFLTTTQLNAASGVAPLDANKLLPLANLPIIPYSSLSGLPLIPIKLSQLQNDLNVLTTSTPIPIGLLPTNIPTSSIIGYGSGFVLTSQVGAVGGVAPLDANKLLPVANLPTIAYSSLSGLPVIPTKLSQLTIDLNFLSSTNTIPLNLLPTNIPTSSIAGYGIGFALSNQIGAVSGIAPLDANKLLPLVNLPTIPYNSLSGLPTIPTKLSQLLNDPNFLTFNTVATVAITGNYSDLIGKPNFDPPGAAAAILPQVFQTKNLFSELNTPQAQTTAKANLALSALATSGNWTDVQGKPTSFPSDWSLLTNKPAFGTIVTKNLGDYLASSLLATANGVAPLDGNALVPLVNLPPITPAKITGFPTVVTSGKYGDLQGLPNALPPNGTATGDLSGSYPNPIVSGFNGINLNNLAAPSPQGGILALNHDGTPHLAGENEVAGALSFTPMNPALALGEITNIPLALQHLGITALATQAPSTVLADSGSTGLIVRTTPGNTRPATSTDLTSAIGGNVYDSLGAATAAVNGLPVSGAQQSKNALISPTDWATFNGKQNTLGFTPENIANKNQTNGYPSLDANGFVPLPEMNPTFSAALTGDVTKPVNSTAATLATVNSAPGSCGDATHSCQILTDGKGRILSQTPLAITGSGSGNGGGTGNVTGSSLTANNFVKGAGASTVADSGKAIPNGNVVGDTDTQTLYNKSIDASEIASGTLVATRLPALTGDVTSTAGSGLLVLPNVNASSGTCGDATHVCQFTTDAKGRVTNETPISISAGGTGTVTNTTGLLQSGRLLVGNGASDLKGGDLSGDIATNGTTVATLPTINSNVGSFGDSSNIPRITVNGKGQITAITTFTAQGGSSGGSAAVAYAQSFSNVSSLVMAHNLNTPSVYISCADSNNQVIETGTIVLTDNNDATVTFAGPRSGRCFASGGSGTAPLSFPFTNQTSVAIAHNLNTVNLVSACYSNTNTLLTPASLTINDANDITVTFASAQSGRCVLNSGIGPQGQNGTNGTSGVSQRYTVTLTSATLYNIPASTHGLNSASINLSCKDATGALFTPGSFTVNPTTYAVQFSMLAAKSGGICSLQ